MDWLPLWNRVLYSRKAQSLDGDTFKAWINLLLVANSTNTNGALPSLDDIAEALRETDETVKRFISTLVAKGLINRAENGLFIHDWAQWKTKAVVSTDRVRAFREREKEKRNVRNAGNVSCNAETVKRQREREREILTPPTPPHGGTAAAAEDPIIAFGIEAIGDRFELEALPTMLSGWRAAKIPDEWIRDAILVATASCRPGGMAAYMNKCLIKWQKRGSPDPEDLAKAKPPAPVEFTVAPRDWNKPKPRSAS